MQDIPPYLRPVLVGGGRAVSAVEELPDELTERLAGALVRARGAPYAMGAMMRRELSRAYTEAEVRRVVSEMAEGLMVGAAEGGSWL